jgi:type IV secretory pathway VirD2 relaxase
MDSGAAAPNIGKYYNVLYYKLTSKKHQTKHEMKKVLLSYNSMNKRTMQHHCIQDLTYMVLYIRTNHTFTTAQELLHGEQRRAESCRANTLTHELHTTMATCVK